MKKIFIPLENIIDDFIFVKGSDFHHLKNVLRKKVGDFIDVSDGGYLYRTKIVEIKSDLIKLEILEKKLVQCSSVRIRLFQAIPKGKIIEDIIRKATELGVSEFFPVVSERTVVKIDRNDRERKIQKWDKIIIETAKKVGISPPMKLNNFVNIQEVKELIGSDDTKLIFWENEEERTLKSFLLNVNKNNFINMVIGPEGGFSFKEVEILKEVGFISVSLGKRIYTVETATLVAISNIIFQLED